MLKLKLLLSLVLSMECVMQQNFKCPSNECQCVYGGSTELYCPNDDDPKISVQVSDPLRIDCKSPNESDYSFLPKLNMDNITSVIVTRCIVPSQNQSFLQALKNINFSNLKSFRFEIGNGARHSGSLTITKNHLKGLETLERLDFSSTKVTAIPFDLFESMGSLKWLSWEWETTITSLPEGIFDPLVDLKTLELHHIKLNTLPSQFLKNQKNLSKLSLSGNYLKNLTRDMFIGANNVDELDLSANELTTLSSDAFAEMSKITVINLSSNDFKTLPEGLFSHNKNLKEFKMVHNRNPFRTLPSNFLAHLTSLEVVEIKADLETLPETVFYGSNKIVNLTLSNNQLEVLPPFLFRDQTDLSLLDLSHNKITELDKDLLSHNKKLTKLVLSYNKIETIPKSFFKENSHLIEIYLNYNHLRTIHHKTISSLINLQILDLSSNKLNFDSIDGPTLTPFDDLNELKKLNLQNNSIKNMLPISSKTLELKLDLSLNNLTAITRDDIKMIGNSVFFIDLRQNQIRSIELGGEDLKAFNTTVKLEENPIECECRLHQKLKNLPSQKKTVENLNCSAPSNFYIESQETLEDICKLTNNETIGIFCPSQCLCLFQNQTLTANCSNAKLHKIPSFQKIELRKDVKSIILYIENNDITELKNLPKNTIEIHAANNRINQIPANLKLNYLNIQNNLIESFNFDSLNGIQNVLLSGNPLLCEEFKVVLVKVNKTKFSDYQNHSCFKDAGQLLKTISLSTLFVCFVLVNSYWRYSIS